MDWHDYSCLEGPCGTYQGSSVRMAEDMHEVKGNSLVATPRLPMDNARLYNPAGLGSFV